MLRALNMFTVVTRLSIRLTILSFAFAIASPSAFAQSTVAGGGNFSLVVKSDGTVWAFGFNNDGQIGDNSTNTVRWPKQVAGLSGIQAVAAGSAHSMALTTTGSLYAWGDNFYNQVASGSTSDKKTPVLLTLSNVVAIAAGEFHSLALTSDGKVYAWGRNNFGQAGGPSSSSVTTPTVVINGDVVAIGAGRTHSLAVKSDGSVWAWGANDVGQLGNGSTSTGVNATPSQVLNVSDATAAIGGGEHSLFLLSDGTVKAVGKNGAGQLGDTHTDDQSTPVAVATLTDVTKIAAGQDHSFALKSDGSAWAWGLGLELGNGGGSNQSSPVQVSGLSGVSAIAGGYSHSIAVTTNGVVFTWGTDNGSGQQGDGTTTAHQTATAISDAGYVWKVATPRITPAGGTFNSNQNVTITTDTGAATIHYSTNGNEPTESDPTYSTAVVVDHTLTLKAKAWKSGLPTSGVATATFVLMPVQPTVSPAAGTYTTAKTVTFSTTTSGASIRYTTDGSTPTESSMLYTAPFEVAHTTTFNIAAFKSGWSSSTVRTAMYTMNFGTLAAPTVDPATGSFTGSVSVTMSSPQSGATIRYTVGNPNNTAPTSNSPEYTSAVPITTTTTVRAKVFHPDYAASTETSRTYTVAAHTPTFSSAAGSYAPGSTVTITAGVATDTLRMTIDGTDPTTSSPQIASGSSILLGNFTLKVKAWRSNANDSAVASAAYTLNAPLSTGSASAGGSHSIVSTPDGRVYAFGANASGQIGNNSTTDVSTPIVLNTITGVTAVLSGLAHTLALTWDGQVYSWGSNTSGRLGDGTVTGIRKAPYHITTLSNVVAVAAGDAFSLALTSDGRVFSWGESGDGQLGLGSVPDTGVPTEIPGLSNVVAIAAGDLHAFAVTASGQLYAWGDDTNSRLGDGGTTQQNSPILISLTDVVAVAAGNAHSIAMTGDGSVYTWGLGNNGQLGHGSTSNYTTPHQISGLHASAIAAGDTFSAAIRGDGALVTWGLNSSGQLGTGSLTPSQQNAPVVISSPASISALSLGDIHSMVVTPTGDVWTWGDFASGRLGDGSTADRPTPAAVVSGISSWSPAAPTVSLPSQTLSSSQTVTLSSSTSGAVIRYNLTGAEPTAADAEVPAGGVEITYSSLLRAKAFVEGRLPGATTRANYQLQSAAPTINPSTGTFTSAQTVTLSVSGPPATIRYTLDGSDPTGTSTAYSVPVNVSTLTTIKAKAFPTNGWAPSATTSATLTFNYGTLAVPTASPNAGAFNTTQSVTLSGSAGSTIRYTLDGSDPSSSSSAFVSPLQVSAGSVIIKARAFHTDWSPSGVLSSPYTIDTTAPVVTATIWPRPNTAGWNNTPVTMTFSCSDNVAIASCPPPVTASSDGVQVIERTATDSAGNSASTSVTVRIDTIPPVVTLSAPSNQSTTTAASISATATASDDRSGLSSVGCNGESQSVSSTIECSVALRPGRNAVVVQASDLAGNTSSAGAHVRRIGTSTQLFLTPTIRTLVVGSTAILALHDEFGADLLGATWTSSDPDVISVSADDPPLLTAIDDGMAVITATKNGLTATADLTAVVATAVIDGLVQWNVATTSGLTMEQPIMANVATEASPDLFIVESDPNGETKVRGATVSGGVVSTETIPGFPLMGDSFGGLIFGIPETPGNDEFLRAIVRTGADEPWRYEGLVSGMHNSPAQSPDGTIYAIEYVDGGIVDGAQFWDLQAIVIDGRTGRLSRRVPLQREATTFTSAQPGQTIGQITCHHSYHADPAAIYGPFVGEDGRGYLLVRRRNLQKSGNCNEDGLIASARIDDVGLDVLVMSSTSAPIMVSVYAKQCTVAAGDRSLCDILPSRAEFEAMPDGLGGTLIRWQRPTTIAGGNPYQYATFISRFNGNLETVYATESSAYLLAVGQDGSVMAAVGPNSYASINTADLTTSWTTSATNGHPVVLSPNGATFLDQTGYLRVIEAGVVTLMTNLGLPSAVYHRGSFLSHNTAGTKSVFLTGRLADATLFQGGGNPQQQKGPRNICLDCMKDYIPPDGHGPAFPDEKRRIITIAIHETWGGDTPNQRILDAMTCAINKWNYTPDAWKNMTGYYFVFDQSQSHGTADITIAAGQPGPPTLDGIGWLLPDGSDKRLPSFMFLWEGVVGNSFTDQDLCGLVAHEIGHKLGAVNYQTGDEYPAASCPKIWSVMSEPLNDAAKAVTALDIELVNQALMYPNTCRVPVP